MTNECMCYVAADPTQPGAAWAVTVDKPEYAKDTAKCIAQWIRKGAHIQRVDRDTAVAMMHLWVRPEKAKAKK